jgi:undecaprenyl-diphosphatase
MLELLDQLDKALFLILNGGHGVCSDYFWQLVTETYTWLPLYIFLVSMFVVRFKKDSIWVILAAVAVVAVCDQLTASFMKPFFGRLRPCHDPAIASYVHVVQQCGGRFGFASSHAANTFGIATFSALVLRYQSGWWKTGYFWAALVAYSRIKVGVHYPGDILAGAAVGGLIGWFIYRILDTVYFRATVKPLV